MCQEFNAPHFLDLRSHLKGAHGIACDTFAEDGTIAAVELTKQKAVVLPKDLRGLRCRLCPQETFLLSQDRAELCSHIRRAHGFRAEVTELKYHCRACQAEFAHTEALLRHGCCEHNGQADYLPQPLCPELALAAVDRESSQPAAKRPRPVESVEKEPKEACPYCDDDVPRSKRASHRAKHPRLDFQCTASNCSRGFAFLEEIVQHLKEAHGIEEEPADTAFVTGGQLASKRLIYLPADLRSLQCPICSRFLLAQNRQDLKLHVERRHQDANCPRGVTGYACRSCLQPGFGSSDEVFNHECMNTAPGGPAAETSDRLPDLENIEYSAPDREGDLRRLVCRLCAIQLNGSAFYKMVSHLEDVHHKFQISRSVCLDDLVLFGCANCPDFEPKSVHNWDRHFGEDNLQCEGSGQGGSATPISAPRAAEPTMREDEEDPSPGDLRLLKCSLCQFTSNRKRFTKMFRHFESEHIRDAKNDLVEGAVVFGCSNCPNFRPPTVLHWDRHFGSGFDVCQGSGRVSGAGAKVRYWCDLCAETRQDFDLHVTGETHKRNAEKASKENTPLLECDACKILVSSEANMKLHNEGNLHVQRTTCQSPAN